MIAVSGASRPSVLFVTDLAYEAQGRRYCDEDIFLTSRLRETFDVALCHPRDAAALLDRFDAVVVRNSGPVLHYQEAYDAFRTRARESGARVHNSLDGRGDMAGKQYLVDLSRAGFPVIPTVDRAADLGLLPRSAGYVVKPKLGADSVGLRFTDEPEYPEGADGTLLVQPRIDFRYEVSFYFVGHDFQYALHAPHPDRRWVLEPYAPTAADLDFARRFVEWNTLTHGIQRVDACRTPEGGLLLVELEDLNPYLSLDLVSDRVREAFVARLRDSVRELLA
uniref:ATP-grasp domain-containing protein n=1 Tax=Streptomyces sp. NBC_00148 TaxID=2903626 RepID=A0AAU1M164_9ACTN